MLTFYRLNTFEHKNKKKQNSFFYSSFGGLKKKLYNFFALPSAKFVGT